MAAPVYQSGSSLAGSFTSTAVIPIPSGVVAGRVIVASVYDEGAGAITPPDGTWTLKQTVTCTGSRLHTQNIYWKRATGAEGPGNYVFTFGGAVWNEGWAASFSGVVASGDPFGAPVNTATTNSTGGPYTATPAVATLTPSQNECLVLFSGTIWNGGGNTWTPPSGFTERIDSETGTLATLTQTTAAATGSVSATTTNSDPGLTGLVAYLLPAVTVFAAAGVIPIVSGVAGAITNRAVVSGVIPIVSGVAGSIGAVRPVSGQIDIVSGVAGAVIRTPVAAAGQIDVVSGVAGNVTRALGIAGQIDIVSGAAGQLSTYIASVSGTVAIVSGVAGQLVNRAVVSGTIPIVSGVAGTIGKVWGPGQMAGQVNIISAVFGNMIVTGSPDQGTDPIELFNPDEVLTGGRVTYYSFDLLDENEDLIGQLQGVEDGDVYIDAYSAVKGTGKLSVYSDPSYSDSPDGQPAFVGARVVTATGPFATATGTSSTPDYLRATDADAADIAIGDTVLLTDSFGSPLEETIFTVTSMPSSGGFTNIFFSPDAATATVATNRLAVVAVTYPQTIDWLNVRVRPMIRIARLGGQDDPDGRLVPAGVYLCAAPVENWDATGLRRNVELIDKLSILDQDIASGDPTGLTAYSAAIGANIIDLVTDLIAETGERYPAIQPDIKVLTSALLWDIGTTRLKIINDLLDAAGYFSLWVDGWGQYQATPYETPAERTPVYESIAPFSDGPESLMDPSWVRDRDIYSIPNRYMVVSQGDGTDAALVSVATNTDPTSPYSFAARGRWITAVEIGVEAVSQAALDTIARGRLSSATSVTTQISLEHIFLPDLHINSVVHFVNPASDLDIYCYVVATSIVFDPTALCKTVMRVVA